MDPSWSATMPATTERLLKDTPLTVNSSLDLNRPAAMVVYFDFKRMIDAFRPWINYGFDVAMGKLKVEGDEENADEEQSQQQSQAALQFGFVVPQVEQLLDVLTAFRSAASITYQEDGIWVTHAETRIEDLK